MCCMLVKIKKSVGECYTVHSVCCWPTTLPKELIPLFLKGDCKTRNETETKRNETSRNETKLGTTETKQDKAEAKRNESKKSSINKKTKQTLTKRFFLHETTIHKMPVADWKTFKIYGKIWPWKKRIIRILYQKAHHFPASCVWLDIDIVLKDIFSVKK
jgi:hypothetical protein